MADFTTATILEQFRNDNAAQSVERVLKKLATKKAEEILAVSYCPFSSIYLSPDSAQRLGNLVFHHKRSYQRTSVPSVQVSSQAYRMYASSQ